MPEIVAFDESGNTGDNLLDPAQPIYVLASIHIGEADAAALIAEAAPHAAGELRSSRLRRSHAGREKVISILSSDLISPGQARITPMHKPYAVVARLFDYLIEPTLYHHGLDAYDRGLHVAYANLLFREAPVACGEYAWSRLLDAFISLCRNPSQMTVEIMLHALRRCLAVCGRGTVQQLLLLIPPMRQLLADRLIRDQGYGIGARDMLDPAITSLLENCITWPERLGPIVVEHDESSVVARWRDKLAVLSSPDAAAEIGEYWAARIPHPLAVDEIRLRDSATSARLQLADVIAGAGVAWLSQFVAGAATDEQFAAALTDVGIGELVENEVWPEPTEVGARF
jgi:hypothetical protein